MTKQKPTKDSVAEVEWESEYFTFRSMWHGAVRLREAGEQDQLNGFWPDMAATLLAYVAYEGFLNHLIKQLYPPVWENERTFFRSPPFVGTLGKTQFLAAGFGLSLNRTARPYRTLAELHDWRNQLVHPQSLSERGRTRADAYAKKPKQAMPTPFRKLAQSGFVTRSFDDVSALADLLLKAAAHHHLSENQDLRKLGRSAFFGPMGLGGASLRR